MTPDHEAAVLEAVQQLATAILAAARADSAAPVGPDRLLDVAAAARTLGVGRSALYSELSAGRLRSLRVGRRRLVPSSAIAEYIADAEREP